MPNNAASKRAGSVQVPAANKLVRGAQVTPVASSAATKVTDEGSTASAPSASTPDTSAIPIGVIVMWGGLVENIPPTWHLCDGTNGTPDLRHNFVLGGTDDADINTTGGVKTHKHAMSGGTATAAIGSTSAGTPAGTVAATFTGSPVAAATTTGSPDLVAADATAAGVSPVTTAAGSVSATFTGSALAGHTHTISGDTETVEHMPPWYKLAFIQKLAA